MTLEWDAAEYEVVSVPHVGWGVGLFEVCSGATATQGG